MNQFIWGVLAGGVLNMASGVSVVWWHFRKGFWMTNPERLEDYPFKVSWK